LSFLNSARLTGDPEGLARALYKLEKFHGGWVERLFLRRKPIALPSILRPHPDTAERVDRLMVLKPSQLPQPELSLHTLQHYLNQIGVQASQSPRRHFNGLWY